MGQSRRAIARSRNMGMRSVMAVFDAADELTTRIVVRKDQESTGAVTRLENGR